MDAMIDEGAGNTGNINRDDVHVTDALRPAISLPPRLYENVWDLDHE
jgi:hypothetical protein